ncbi:MAG: radical SAM protein, partial [Planctomycetota bacterium]
MAKEIGRKVPADYATWRPRLARADQQTEAVVLEPGEYTSAERVALDPRTMKAWVLKDKEPPPQADGLEFKWLWDEWRVEPAQGVVLVLSGKCCMECDYCYYAPSWNLSDQPMTLATVRDAIKKCRAQAEQVAKLNPHIGGRHSDQVDIAFHGREPLAEWARLQDITGTDPFNNDRSNEGVWGLFPDVRFSFSLFTNGVLVSDAVADWIADHVGSLTVSLDGPPAVHNKHRKLAADPNGGSYAETKAGLERLRDKDAGSRAKLNATFTKDNLALLDRLDHANQLCDEGLAAHFMMSPVRGVNLLNPDLVSDMAFTVEDIKESTFKDEISAAFAWMKERARNDEPARWFEVNRIIWRALTRTPQATRAVAAARLIFVGPDGSFYPCMGREYNDAIAAIGNVSGGYDPDKWENWVDCHRIDSVAACAPGSSADGNCPVALYCGGICPADAEVHCGNPTVPWDVHCEYMKILVGHALELIADLKPKQYQYVANWQY